MFATRANQENAIYEQQQAAAAKPLNHGVKGLAPKTPGNKAPKTPFKVPLNDENDALGGGKTGGKGEQGGLFGEGKSGKVDKSAFVTPAGPRNRAVLGNKTTNAKATAFQTPAPLTQEKQSAKPTSPRLRKGKIKVHEAEAATAEQGEQEREIEFMPPREVPLPDHPEDWPIDRTYPQFEGQNLMRGWWSEFSHQKDDDGDSEFSDFEEKLKQVQELEKKKMQAQQAKKQTGAPKNSTGLQKTTRDPLLAKAPQTLKARSAASALSNPTKPAAAKATAPVPAPAKSRLPSILASKKPSTTTQPASGNMRHGAARAASNSTLGYSKGRAVSAASRAPLSSVHDKPTSAAHRDQQSPAKTTGSSLEDLFGLQGLHIDDEDAELVGFDGGVGAFEEDEDLKDFQLETVEL